jgi:serine protease Do
MPPGTSWQTWICWIDWNATKVALDSQLEPSTNSAMFQTGTCARRAPRAWMWLSVLGLSLTPEPGVPASVPIETHRAVDAAIESVKPALVRLRVVSTRYVDGRELKYQSVGSGVIITPEGHIVTNHHVAGHAVRIFCTLSDREEIEAELVGTDPLTDISVVLLKPRTPRQFPLAAFGDSSRLRVGDQVLAMGSPMALSQSVTLGIISNIEMILPSFFGPWGRLRQDGEDVGALVRWIAHDAAIYGGNSGGPLVDLHGQIIGINEIRMGLGGAIPGNLANQVAQTLIREGRVPRAWLGFEAQPLLKRSEADRGVLVSSVLEDSPAHDAGLRSGDIIIEAGGKPILVRHDEELPIFAALITDLPVGEPVAFTVLRDNRERTLTLTPLEREEVWPRQREFRAWGVTARNLSSLLARELKRPSTDGVLVTSIRPGGPAGEAKPRIEPQDVIVEINEQPVRSIEDLQILTATLTDGRDTRVPALVGFQRKERRYLTVVRLGSQDLLDPGLEATKGWIPIETEVISRDIAAHLQQPNLRGFYITHVHPDSTATRAGLQVGDLLLAIDGDPLTANAPEHVEEWAARIRQYDPGLTVDLTVFRDPDRMVVPVEVVRSPRLRREMKRYRNNDFEFTVRDIAFQDRTDEQWPATQTGVLVEEVRSGSWAELGMLYAGDLIIEVDGQPVTEVDSMRSVMEQVALASPSHVVLKILRGIHNRYLVLEPKWNL